MHGVAGFSLTLLGAWLSMAVNARALDVPLTVTNPEMSAKTSAPVTSGVPFARGVLADNGPVRLLLSGREIPGQFKTTARWPNGSVRWLLCDFQIDLAAGGTQNVTLQTGTAPAPVTGITVPVNDAATLTVNTGAAVLSFNKAEFRVRGNLLQAASGGITYTAVPAPGGWVLEESGPLKTVVRVDGAWFYGAHALPLRDSLIRFRARLFFYRNKSEVTVALTFRNNNSFGWDAWDPGFSRKPDLTVTGLSFGVPLLAAGGVYVFGSSVEKTFEVVVPASGSPILRATRYMGNGAVAAGYVPDRPLAVASPAYYSETGAWGRIGLPVTGLPSTRQPDFDLYEKIQRAKVNPGDLQNPPNLTGITMFQHLYQDIASWNDYGDLRWGGDTGRWSSNHYDWSYGMYLQFMRTGFLPFANAARVMARHEIDFDVYHTDSDGQAFNYQKDWESRSSHNNPGNDFGGGRPSHTWSQGYALHWLLTGDPRGRDGCEEILEGVRQYVYESFNDSGYVDTNEIRIQGWLTENLITLWRIEPQTVWSTANYGTKTIPGAIKDILKNVFDREAAAGKKGFVYAGDPVDRNTRDPLQNSYFIEPAAKAFEEIFYGLDPVYAEQLLSLLKRMTRFLMSVTYGGDTKASGLYRPLQIPMFLRTPTQRTDGQIVYLLMAGNAAAFCFLHGGESDFANYYRSAFRDYVRYMGVTGPDTYIDPSLRTPASYNSSVYWDTESKIHGWSNRYGMFLLTAERAAKKSGDDFLLLLLSD
jgi:hypothetical protein